MNESILICAEHRLGDAVMSTPALLRLRAARPAARILLLTPAKLRELWTDHPAVNDVLTFAEGESAFSVGRRLRAMNIGTALILPDSRRSALECWLAKIPRRIGYVRPWRTWMLTDKVPPRAAETALTKRSPYEVRLLIETGIDLTRPTPPVEAHQLYQYLELAGVLGASKEPCAPEVAVVETAAAAACKKYDATPKSARVRPLIGINAGAEYASAKRWPTERFVEAAAAFHQQRGCDWWVFGGPTERDLSEEIANALRDKLGATGKVECLAGRTSLGELCAALKVVDVLLTNDTGPMHLAAAVGTPVVALFGSTSPELTGPGLPGDPRHQLVREVPACAPCFLPECPIDHRCLTGLPVERVVKALTKVVEAAFAGR